MEEYILQCREKMPPSDMDTTSFDTDSSNDEYRRKRKPLSLSSCEEFRPCCSCKKLKIGTDLNILWDVYCDHARYRVDYVCETTPISLRHYALAKILNVSKNFNNKLLTYINSECVPLRYLYELEFKIILPWSLKITLKELEDHFRARERGNSRVIQIRTRNTGEQVKVLPTCSCTYHSSEQLRNDPERFEFFTYHQRKTEGRWLPGFVHCGTCIKLKTRFNY